MSLQVILKELQKQSVQNTQNYTTPQFSNSQLYQSQLATKLSQWIGVRKLIADAMVNSKNITTRYFFHRNRR